MCMEKEASPALPIWFGLLFSESDASSFLFISREMQREGNKLSPSVLATWIRTSAS